MTEKCVLRVLNGNYMSNIKYKVDNIFVFNWESDLFIQRTNGYCTEYEVKVTKEDFKQDFKKKKHELFSSVKSGEIKEKCPNKFYYAVPENLISISDVPEYAGLIYVTKHSLKEIKRAPFLHKQVYELEKDLCHKFYYYWKSLSYDAGRLKNEIESLKIRLDKNGW